VFHKELKFLGKKSRPSGKLLSKGEIPIFRKKRITGSQIRERGKCDEGQKKKR